MRRRMNFSRLYRVDDEGRIALQIWFDLDDMDAALAELDALQFRFEDERPQARRISGGREFPPPPASPQTPNVELDNECVRVIGRVDTAVHSRAWGEVERPDRIQHLRREPTQDSRLPTRRFCIRRICKPGKALSRDWAGAAPSHDCRHTGQARGSYPT